jgi:hypothetical protein
MAWKRSDWNSIIQRANSIIETCGSDAEPLDEAPENHIWSADDIMAVRDKLTEICTIAPEFSTELVKWKQEIIDELNTAINECDCTTCPIENYNSVTARDYALVTFSTSSELDANKNAALNYKTESLAASLIASNELATLVSLMESGASVEAVNAQVEVVNADAATAWGYISAANTERYSYEPAHQWIDLDRIKCHPPRLVTYQYDGETLHDWRFCYTEVRVHVLNHACYGSPYTAYGYDMSLYFQSSPDGHLFCCNTDGIFTYSNKFACAADFVGDGDCSHRNACIAAIEAAGLQQKVTVMYETVEAMY